MHVYYYTRPDRKEKTPPTTTSTTTTTQLVLLNYTGITILTLTFDERILLSSSLPLLSSSSSSVTPLLFEFESLSSSSSTLLLSSSLPRHLNSSNLSSQMIAHSYWIICTYLLKLLLRDKCVIRFLSCLLFYKISLVTNWPYTHPGSLESCLRSFLQQFECFF